jgi:hypothetical protein
MTVSPIIAMTLGTLGAIALAKFIGKEWRRVNDVLHARDSVPVTEKAVREKLPTLRRDPRTGIYRPD